jgi:hypothetical protein
MKQILPRGWNRKKLPNGKWEITVPTRNVGIKPSTGQLIVPLGYSFEPGDVINVPEGQVSHGVNATIIESETIDCGYNTFTFLTVECENKCEFVNTFISRS